MSLQVRVVDQIGDIPAADFDALDTSAGVSSCHARTRQRESDGRWRLRYLRCHDHESLKAVIPLYTSRAKAWPDPSYDPATWPSSETGSQDPMTPRTSLLVGGCTYLQSSLHTRPDFRDSEPFRHVLAEIASLAAEEGRGLIFPYHYAAAKDALTRASDGGIAWSPLEREAVLRDVSSPTWEADLGSRPRYSLRTDAKQIAAAGLTSAVRTWDEVEESVSELIADHNGEKGRADHPEFVRMRYREWARCDGVGIVVFTSESKTVYGVVTALIWNGDLEMQEVGLTGPPGPDRHAAYLDLVFRQPIEYARAHGLRDIRLGPMALKPKASRGAFFRELYGGTLSVTVTKALAQVAAQAATWPNEPEVRR
jgi:hypothetical protein